MSRYVISGYYGFGNAGDEAILQAIIDSLQSHDSGADITVFSAQPSKTALEHQVRAVHRTSFAQIVAALRQADLFISGGGGLLQDATSNRSLLYYLGLLTLARGLGCKTMVYANSIGPIKRTCNKRLACYVLEKTDFITVRDQLSLNLLAELGVHKPQIQLTADPALLLPSPVVAPEERVIALAVREWPSQHDFLMEIAVAGRRLVQDGFSILLIPFHFARDLAVSQRLAQEIGAGASCLMQAQSFDDLVIGLARSEVVVAMRLHALIMGAVCNRPLIGISYDPKIEGFLQSVDQPIAGSTADLQADHLYELVLAAYNQRVEVRSNLAEQLVKLRQYADKNAIIATSLAGGERA